jgi:hypothetical protein
MFNRIAVPAKLNIDLVVEMSWIFDGKEKDSAV